MFWGDAQELVIVFGEILIERWKLWMIAAQLATMLFILLTCTVIAWWLGFRSGTKNCSVVTCCECEAECAKKSPRQSGKDGGSRYRAELTA